MAIAALTLFSQQARGFVCHTNVALEKFTDSIEMCMISEFWLLQEFNKSVVKERESMKFLFEYRRIVVYC